MNAGPAPTLGQVLEAALSRCSLSLPSAQLKILRRLAACRTPALGGHRYRCAQCGREHFVPHSCRNRHCPQCQGSQAIDWLDRQSAALLPIPYFHLVFTVPHRLNGLIRQNRRALFNLLFAAVSQTLLEFGRRKFKARIGLTAVLHTWGQTLVDHYHLHCIVTGGGLALDRSGWVASSGYYLFAVQALGKVFAGKFCAGLKELHARGALKFYGAVAPLADPEAYEGFVRELKTQSWVVYAKRPFAGPGQVLAYLSRYTHRVAISNRRLLALDGQNVTFSYKDYADGQRNKTMTLPMREFVRRFCLHLLPERFVKIRHYGLLGNRNREQRLAEVRQSLGAPALEGGPVARAMAAGGEEAQPMRCPFCGARTLVWMEEVRPCRPIKAVMICDSS